MWKKDDFITVLIQRQYISRPTDAGRLAVFYSEEIHFICVNQRLQKCLSDFFLKKKKKRLVHVHENTLYNSSAVSLMGKPLKLQWVIYEL